MGLFTENKCNLCWSDPCRCSPDIIEAYVSYNYIQAIKREKEEAERKILMSNPNLFREYYIPAEDKSHDFIIVRIYCNVDRVDRIRVKLKNIG